MDIVHPSFTYNNLQIATSGEWHNIHCNTNVETVSCLKTVSTISTDTRTNNKNALFVALSGDNFDAHNFLKEAVDSGAAALCLENGKYKLDSIPSYIPVLEVLNTLKAYQDIANFHRKRLKKLVLIAITGSNGKTSTKDILSCLLSSEFGEESVYTTKANTNNLIGVPQNILNLTDMHRFAVIELGSNHPGEISRLAEIANPDIAVITSIGPSHLEYFNNINGVIKEKTDIFTTYNNPDKGIAIIPVEYRDNNIFLQKTSDLDIITFGRETGLKPLRETTDISWKHLRSTIEKCDFELNWEKGNITEKISWTIPGIHQLNNAAAAATVATAVGIAPSNIEQALKNCKISGMRMRVNKSNGITWINDAYNANPTSTKAGIDWLQEILKETGLKPVSTPGKHLYVILGDMLELGENAPNLHKEIIEYAVDKLPSTQIYCVGTIMCNVETGFKPVSTFHNSDEATSFFKNELKPGDIVYLKGSRGIALEKIEQRFTGKI